MGKSRGPWSWRSLRATSNSSGTNPHRANTPGRRLSSGGQVMIIFALAAVVVIGIAGLAVDAGLNYMTRTSLQAAGDTASYTGAQMLGADYFAEENGNPAPFSYAQVTGEVQNSVAGNHAGAYGATSYDGYFTTASSSAARAGLVVCQFAGSPVSGVIQCSDTAAVVSLLEGAGLTGCADTEGLPTCGGLVAVTGVKVVPSNTHPTLLESIVGIHKASEQASATSVFAFINAAQSNYIVWWDCIYDPTTGASSAGQITVGETIDYFNNNGLSKQGSCITTTDSKFKGNIKPPGYPNPMKVPGWLQAYGGVGSAPASVNAGQLILLPLVNCLFNATTGTVDSGTECPPPYPTPDPGPYVDCGSSFSQPLGSGSVVMCIVGLVWVQAGNNCNVTNTSSVCWGTVTTPPNGGSGFGYCEPESNDFPNCGNVIDKAAIKPTIQLLQ